MVVSRIGWFEKLMALVLSFFTLLMFFGVSSANHTSIRDVDSTIGLLSRPSNSKIVKSFKAFFAPVKASAQNTVNIANDVPRLLEQALNKALKAALSALIKFFLDQIMKLFDKLISAIEGWVGTIDGLRDAIGAFRGAVALKAYQVSECLIESSESLVNSILPSEDQSTHDPKDKCNGVFGSSESQPASDANKTLNDAVSTYKTNVAITASQKGIDPSKTIPNTKSEAELEVQKEEIATNAALLSGCGGGQDGSSSPDSVLNGGILPAGNITALRSGCKEEINNAKEKLTETTQKVQETVEQTIDQTVAAAPADCKSSGFVTGLNDLGSVDEATAEANSIQGLGTNVLNGADLSNLEFSKADSSLKIAGSFDAEVLNGEQCQTANRMPAVLEAANQNNAGSSGNEFNFDAVIAVFIETFTQFINNIINKVFTVLTEAINNFLRNAPGGEFLSQAISNVIDPINAAITTDLNALADSVTQTLQDEL